MSNCGRIHSTNSNPFDRYATAQGPSFDRSAASGFSSSSRADPLARGAPKKFEFTFPNSNLPPSGSEVRYKSKRSFVAIRAFFLTSQMFEG